MAQLFTKTHLSGSAGGKPIKVTAVGSPGTLIHATAGLDEVWLWASNVGATPLSLTLEWGGTTYPDNLLVYQLVIPPNSAPIPVAPGFILDTTQNVRAYVGGVVGTINITGYVHRIT